MGIPNRAERDGHDLAVDRQRMVQDRTRALQARRQGPRIEVRLPHRAFEGVGGACVRAETQSLDAGERPDSQRLPSGLARGERGRQAAHAVARHLRLASVGVEDPGAHGRFRVLRRIPVDQDAVGSDAAAPVADPARQSRDLPVVRSLGLELDDDEVVAERVQLGEVQRRAPWSVPRTCLQSGRSLPKSLSRISAAISSIDFPVTSTRTQAGFRSKISRQERSSSATRPRSA